MFKEQTLITGGTGSFGNAVPTVLSKGLREIRMFSRDEKTG